MSTPRMAQPGPAASGMVSSGDSPGIDSPGLDQPGVGGGTATLVERETSVVPRTSHGDGDHERFSHYAPKDKILEAMVTGTPIKALCGKVWVPSRDPQRFPLCPTCKEIYETIPPGDDES